MKHSVTVVGAGLAGTEAALQLAEQGIAVRLYEMRPTQMTPAHRTSQCAELVCSNSLGSDSQNTASWMLKREMEILGSFVLKAAYENRVAAGASLAVDRERFSSALSRQVKESPLIELCREELTQIPESGIVLVATGPLTSQSLSRSLQELLGVESLYFYDAISPIVAAESLDFDVLFFANRYGKGETPDFLNLPLNEAQYNEFIDDILGGEVVLPHDFEEEKYFEGCMPIEAIAGRGRQTLAFGPMKPVGLTDPKTGKRPYAVVQLRTENRHKTAYNLVGFQTKLKYPEQQRIFRKLPGMQNAEFLRLGCMHRNTYVDSPRALFPSLQLQKNPRLFLAGQLTGTEGYLESAATGLWASKNIVRFLEDKPFRPLPESTMLGALINAVTDKTKENFQPMNSNMGIMPPLAPELSTRNKQERNERFAKRSQDDLRTWLEDSAAIASAADCRLQNAP